MYSGADFMRLFCKAVWTIPFIHVMDELFWTEFMRYIRLKGLNDWQDLASENDAYDGEWPLQVCVPNEIEPYALYMISASAPSRVKT